LVYVATTVTLEASFHQKWSHLPFKELDRGIVEFGFVRPRHVDRPSAETCQQQPDAHHRSQRAVAPSSISYNG
jgi:hypothetical protein